MKEKIILFDLDGTLIDSTSAILDSFDIAFKHFDKVTPKDEDITSLIGYPLDIIFEKLNIEKKQTAKYVKIYKDHYLKVAKEKTMLLQDAKEAILQAFDFANIGIVTTKTSSRSKELLEYLEVLKYFDVIIGREDVINPKPHSEPILKALKNLDVKNRSTWMIGDTILDLKSAQSANVNSAAVLCGYGKKEDLLCYTNNIFSNTLKAVEFIKDSNSH